MNLSHHGGSCGHSCCLRVENMSVKIGTDCILKDVNLHVHCGEMAAIIGPEGVIAFSEPGQRSKKPRIGYVPQSPAFDPSDPVSVSDLFACCMSRRPAFLGLGKAMKDTVAECLSRVHGEELVNKRVGTLSGGELQRVLLALALEPIPNILILDEPLSGVDVEGMETLMDMLDEIRKNYDLSILMTTHDFSLLPRYADQVVLIDHGVLIQGDPQTVLDSEEFHRTFHMRGGRA